MRKLFVKSLSLKHRRTENESYACVISHTKYLTPSVGISLLTLGCFKYAKCSKRVREIHWLTIQHKKWNTTMQTRVSPPEPHFLFLSLTDKIPNYYNFLIVFIYVCTISTYVCIPKNYAPFLTGDIRPYNNLSPNISFVMCILVGVCGLQFIE